MKQIATSTESVKKKARTGSGKLFASPSSLIVGFYLWLTPTGLNTQNSDRFIGPVTFIAIGILFVAALRYPLGPALEETGSETILSQPRTRMAQTQGRQPPQRFRGVYPD